MSSGGRAPRHEGRLSSRRVPYDKRHVEEARLGKVPKSELQPETDDSDGKDGLDLIKVSGHGDVKLIAGKLAHCVRDDDTAPTVLTIGPPSINVAVKAIAVARKLLADDDRDLICQPAFREGMSDNALALYLTSKKGNRVAQNSKADEFPVKEQTDRLKLAGAIAARVRTKEAIYLLAQGANAVANSISAICRARMYLENDELDVQFLPKFIELENDGVKSNFLRIDIRPVAA